MRSQLRDPVEQIGIGKPRGTVLLRRQHLHATPSEGARDARGHMHIHVGREAHCSDFNRLSRRWNGDSPSSDFHAATSRSRRNISCSNSA